MIRFILETNHGDIHSDADEIVKIELEKNSETGELSMGYIHLVDGSKDVVLLKGIRVKD